MFFFFRGPLVPWSPAAPGCWSPGLLRKRLHFHSLHIVIGLVLLFVGILINVARKFARLLKAGSWGGKHSARMIGFKKTHMLEACIAWKTRGLGRRRGAAPPRICKHIARIMGFYRSYALKKWPDGFQPFKSHDLKKACTASRGGGGGLGGDAANTMLRRWLSSIHEFETRLHY